MPNFYIQLNYVDHLSCVFGVRDALAVNSADQMINDGCIRSAA